MAAETRDFLDETGVRRLMKPFTIEEVHRVLDATIAAVDDPVS